MSKGIGKVKTSSTVYTDMAPKEGLVVECLPYTKDGCVHGLGATDDKGGTAVGTHVSKASKNSDPKDHVQTIPSSDVSEELGLDTVIDSTKKIVKVYDAMSNSEFGCLVDGPAARCKGSVIVAAEAKGKVVYVGAVLEPGCNVVTEAVYQTS